MSNTFDFKLYFYDEFVSRIKVKTFSLQLMFLQISLSKLLLKYEIIQNKQHCNVKEVNRNTLGKHCRHNVNSSSYKIAVSTMRTI